MKKLLLITLCWPIFQLYPYHGYAQKNKTQNDNSTREVIIIKNNEKNNKITVETKNGEVFINGKPASEYKDDNVSVITGEDRRNNFVYSGDGNMQLFNEGGRKPFLGVTTEKTDNGVKITDISESSAAEKAGLKEGDIITKVDGKTISDPEDLINAITAHKPKDEVKIYFTRNGKSNNVRATLGERSFGSFSFNNNDLAPMRLLQEYNFKMPKMPRLEPMHITPGQSFSNVWRLGNHRLGIKIEDTENDGGAKITHVDEGSVAEKAGLKNDDVITEVNGKAVKNVGEVLDQVRDVNDKTSYTVKAKRNGADMNFDIKIPKKKNNADL